MNVQQLAKEMGVTENDIYSLMNMALNSIKQDLAAEVFVNLSQEAQTEMVMAYVQSEVKKFNEFCMTLLTNSEKKRAFDLYIFDRLSC